MIDLQQVQVALVAEDLWLPMAQPWEAPDVVEVVSTSLVEGPESGFQRDQVTSER